MPPTRDSFARHKRRPAVRPLADLVQGCISPALAKQGFSEADVLLHWSEIVGDGLAERCRPVRLQWRRSGGGIDEPNEPATLVVRVEGAFALALQHMAPVVLERVNAYFGWRCVGKLVLRQGPLPERRDRRAVRSPPDSGTRELALQATAEVADDRLRAALVGLGARVLTVGR